MSEELKVCPFCAGVPIVATCNDPFEMGGMRTNGTEWRTIGCRPCGFFFSASEFVGKVPSPLRNKALYDKWNTRPLEDQCGCQCVKDAIKELYGSTD